MKSSTYMLMKKLKSLRSLHSRLNALYERYNYPLYQVAGMELQDQIDVLEAQLTTLRKNNVALRKQTFKKEA